MSYTEKDLRAIKSEVVMVDPVLARTIRESCVFERQRNISDLNVTRLAGEMRNGWFIAGTPILMCVLPDKSMRLVNGNHTLEAIRKTGISLPLTFIYIKVPDIEAVGRIYACLDLQRIRSWGDAIRAGGYNEDVPLASKIVSAVGVIMAEFKHVGPSFAGQGSRNARFLKLKDYETPGRLLAEAIAGCPIVNKRLILRKAIAAVALETFRYQPSMAADFWRGMALDDGLRTTDSRKALLRFLGNVKVETGSEDELATAAALAWNAYFSGKDLSVCRPGRAGFRLSGTPWTGGKTAARIPPDETRLDPASAVASHPMYSIGISNSHAGPAPVIQFEGERKP